MSAYVSAQTDFTIHLEENGNAIFYGSSEEQTIDLPDGVFFSSEGIRGATSNLTKKEGNIWEFNFSFPDSEIQIFLPSNAVIKKSSGELAVNKKYIVIYATDSVYIQYSIDQKEPTLLFLGYYFLAALIIIAIFIFYKKKNKAKIKYPDKLEIIHDLLNERDQQILTTLKETGKIKSSYLRRKLNLPKASFSRHIQELEKKKIIKRSGEGKNKFIELV